MGRQLKSRVGRPTASIVKLSTLAFLASNAVVDTNPLVELLGSIARAAGVLIQPLILTEPREPEPASNQFVQVTTGFATAS